jgi:hypothetical protein
MTTNRIGASMKLLRFTKSVSALMMTSGAALSFLMSDVASATAAEVRLWETNQSIPTYRVGPPDPNPRFFQGRA